MPTKYILSVLLFQLLIISSGCGPALQPSSRPCPEIAVAEINGQPVPQQELLNHIMNPSARAVLDEMILTRIVRDYAAARGIQSTPALIQEQYNQTLERMAPGKSRYQQEALFNYMLQRRQYERQTFDLILERQALLLPLIDKTVTITPEILQAEFQRQFGRRLVIRQLVVNSFRLISQAHQRLQSGESFLSLVRDLSQDQLSLPADGQIGPFSQADEDIPAPVREHAFTLTKPGELSELFSVYDKANAQWWYLIELIREIPAEDKPLAEVQGQLEEIIRRQTIQQRLIDLQKQLRDEARVTILDGRLLLPAPPKP